MNLFRRPPQNQSDLITSSLFDEKTFYESFVDDLKQCKREVIIESPYITSSRMKYLWPVFKNLLDRGVKISIFTKPPLDHDERLRQQAEIEIQNFERMGIQALLCVGSHHRKLAIIDREILWEGSLNILSQTQSREIMRRIESKTLTDEMVKFLKLDSFL